LSGLTSIAGIALGEVRREIAASASISLLEKIENQPHAGPPMTTTADLCTR
jgi:hypothetical protein